MNDAINMLCTAIASNRQLAVNLIDRVQKSINNHLQQRFRNTYTYITKQENINKLLAGDQNCIIFFDNLEIPLSMDLQNNENWLQFIEQLFIRHVKEFVNIIED